MKTEFMLPPSGWKHLTNHPLSELVGFGVGIDVDALAAHMKEHGYDEHEAIILYRDGKIDTVLDGRHKLKACIIADVTPTFRRFVGKSPEAYIAKKAFRQHLNASQRAMIAAAIANGKHGGDRSKSSIDDLKSREEAAATLNVGTASVDRAKDVIEKGTEELQEAVKDGTIKVSDAAKVASEPPKVQNEAVKKVRSGKAKTATKAIEETKEEIIRDGLKVAVPENLRSVFEKASEFRSIMHGLSDLKSRINELSKHKAGGWIDQQDAEKMLKQAHAHLRFAMPFTECPKCRRKPEKKCQACKGTGWINETVYGSSASDADKKWLEDRK